MTVFTGPGTLTVTEPGFNENCHQEKCHSSNFPEIQGHFLTKQWVCWTHSCQLMTPMLSSERARWMEAFTSTTWFADVEVTHCIGIIRWYYFTSCVISTLHNVRSMHVFSTPHLFCHELSIRNRGTKSRHISDYEVHGLLSGIHWSQSVRINLSNLFLVMNMPGRLQWKQYVPWRVFIWSHLCSLVTINVKWARQTLAKENLGVIACIFWQTS